MAVPFTQMATEALYWHSSELSDLISKNIALVTVLGANGRIVATNGGRGWNERVFYGTDPNAAHRSRYAQVPTERLENMTMAQYDGAFFSTYALTRNLIAFLCAMTFRENLAGVMERLISGKHPAHDYFVLISFVVILGAAFLLGRFLKVQYTVPQVPCPDLVDKIGGSTVGFVNGVLVSGVLLIAWSLVPFAKYIPADLGRVQIKAKALDTGAVMLCYYKFAEERMGGNVPFLLDDEKIVDDLNHNGRADPGEGFQDSNFNREWDRGWLWRYRNQASITPEAVEPLPVSTAG